MKFLYVTGGKQRTNTLNVKEWNQYEKAIALAIDLQSGEVVNRCEYATPAEFCASTSNPAILFKSATFQIENLYVCTQTELLCFSLPDFDLKNHVSLPCFNDVHHVSPTKTGSLLVAVTGLDLVLEVTLRGEILREWSTTGDATWDKFSRETDYRKVLTTKPHVSHPNYIFQIESDIWVTRFEQKDAICLTSSDKRIDIGVERPHDGCVFGDNVYFTTVDGHIVVADISTLKVVKIFNLNKITGSNKPLGWCRGLHIINECQILVGFSRIRPTKFHSNLMWLRGQVSDTKYVESKPTRVALYDLRSNRLEWEYDLEPHGLNALFSAYVCDQLSG